MVNIKDGRNILLVLLTVFFQLDAYATLTWDNARPNNQPAKCTIICNDGSRTSLNAGDDFNGTGGGTFDGSYPSCMRIANNMCGSNGYKPVVFEPGTKEKGISSANKKSMQLKSGGSIQKPNGNLKRGMSPLD
jgi:hypothetical protein